MNRKIGFIAILAAMVITLGACGIMKNPYEIIISKIVCENGKVYHGELLKIDDNFKESQMEDFSLRDMRCIGNGHIIGLYDWGKNIPAPIAIYDIKSRDVNIFSTIESDINEQRLSVNSDETAIYYAVENGVERYDIASGEKKNILNKKKIYYPVVTKDESSLYFFRPRDGIVKCDIRKKTEKVIIKDAAEFDLSSDEEFIIFSRVSDNGEKTTFYKYDIKTGEEEIVLSLNKRVHKITIAEDGKKFLYVSYTNAFFPDWAKEIIYVHDLETNKTSKIFKSKSGRISAGIVLIK